MSTDSADRKEYREAEELEELPVAWKAGRVVKVGDDVFIDSGSDWVRVPMPADSPLWVSRENEPASLSDTGTKGEVFFNDTHFYVCFDTDQWLKFPPAPTILVSRETEPTEKDPGTKGEVYFNTQFFYVCVDTDVWKRFEWHW